jgi:hypothetical protein
LIHRQRPGEFVFRGRSAATIEHAVVIAGGGPTGLMLAGELALAGVDVATSDDELMTETLEILRRRNVVGVTSGPYLERWREAGGDRIIPALGFTFQPDAPAADEVRESLACSCGHIPGPGARRYRRPLLRIAAQGVLSLFRRIVEAGFGQRIFLAFQQAAMNLRRSSIGLHSFQGIWVLPKCGNV